MDPIDERPNQGLSLAEAASFQGADGAQTGVSRGDVIGKWKAVGAGGERPRWALLQQMRRLGRQSHGPGVAS